jgi:GNAT superfamily N-acetyltransferase
MVAERDGKLLGFAALDVEHSVLSQLFVAPPEKRRGIGQQLFDWAVSRSAGRLRLKTLVENAESRAFYTRLGMMEGGTSMNGFNGREEIEYTLWGVAVKPPT